MLIRAPFRHGAGLPTWLLFMSMAALSVSCGQQPRAENAAEPTPQTAAASASPIPWKTIEPPAQVGIPTGSPKPYQPSAVRTFSGTGVIRAVHLDQGWFEIDHEEIAGYMPAMRMQWSVKDRSLLKSVRAGDKVDFTLEDNNGSEIITTLKKTAATQ